MSYYVVTLERGDPLQESNFFHFLGCRLLKESHERVRARLLQTGDSSFIKDLEYVEVYTFGEGTPAYEHTVPEWMRFHMPTPEYQRFGKVYFLNDLAYRMYMEGRVEFEAAKIIQDEELPLGCTRNLSAPYLPKAE